MNEVENAIAARDADPGAAFAAVAELFGLLSEPTRLRILHAICRSEQSVGSIVRATGARQTNVSRHLARLHRSGVVSRRKERNVVFYRLAGPEFLQVCGAMCGHIASRVDERQPRHRELLEFVAQL